MLSHFMGADGLSPLDEAHPIIAFSRTLSAKHKKCAKLF
jgi:hypothetical protein